MRLVVFLQLGHGIAVTLHGCTRTIGWGGWWCDLTPDPPLPKWERGEMRLWSESWILVIRLVY